MSFDPVITFKAYYINARGDRKLVGTGFPSKVAALKHIRDGRRKLGLPDHPRVGYYEFKEEEPAK